MYTFVYLQICTPCLFTDVNNYFLCLFLDMYSCSPMTKMMLLKSGKMSMRPLILQIGGMYKLWDHLSDIVQNGKTFRQFNVNISMLNGPPSFTFQLHIAIDKNYTWIYKMFNVCCTIKHTMV